MENNNYIMLQDMSKLTVKMLHNIIKKHLTKDVKRLKKLKDYYDNKVAIDSVVKRDSSKPNNKIKVPFAKMITSQINNYFMAKPISYLSENELILSILNDINEINNQEYHNNLLAKDISIYGVAYELVYIEDSNIKFVKLDAKEMIMIYDYSIDAKPIGAIRYYTINDYETNSETLYVEVYDDKSIKYYANNLNELKLVDEKLNPFNQLMINIYENNDEQKSDYEDVISLIDGYNTVVSENSNEIASFSDSYLVITNVSDSTADDFKTMKDERIILLPENSSANFLTRESSFVETTETHRKQLKQDIYRSAQIPDLSEDLNIGSSGVALKHTYYSLENLVSHKEVLFRNGINYRLSLIFNYLNMIGYSGNPREVELIFTRSLPQNEEESYDLVNKLNGIVSKETLLAQLPFIKNPKDEMDKIKAENESNAMSYSFDDDSDEDINDTIIE